MKKFKDHKYIMPKDSKNCVLYNIANVFDVPLDFLDKYKVDGVTMKDTEHIINNIGYPKSYLSTLGYICQVPGDAIRYLPENMIKFILESVINFSDKTKYLLVNLVITLKNNSLHSIFLLINKDKIILSDARKPYMVELTLDELLPLLRCEQIAVLLSYKEFRKSYITYLDI